MILAQSTNISLGACTQCNAPQLAYLSNGRPRTVCSRACTGRRPRPDMLGNRWGVGYSPSQETRAAVSARTKLMWSLGLLHGTPAWNKGKSWPPEMRLKMSLARYGKGRKDSPKTPLTVRIRTSNLYQKWRTAIYERDGYTCVICGELSRKGNRVILNADHHPISFSQIVTTHSLKTYQDALSCVLLWDITNGRTLCKLCHDKKHGKC